MSFVLDASVALRWYCGDGSEVDAAYAMRVLESLGEGTAVVPSIWGLELANVIAKTEAQGLAPEARSVRFLALVRSLGIVCDEQTHERACSETLNLARRYQLSAYDAAYLELALRLSLPLATLDGGLRVAVNRAGGCVYAWS